LQAPPSDSCCTFSCYTTPRSLVSLCQHLLVFYVTHCRFVAVLLVSDPVCALFDFLQRGAVSANHPNLHVSPADKGTGQRSIPCLPRVISSRFRVTMFGLRARRRPLSLDLCYFIANVNLTTLLGSCVDDRCAEQLCNIDEKPWSKKSIFRTSCSVLIDTSANISHSTSYTSTFRQNHEEKNAFDKSVNEASPGARSAQM